MARTHPSRRYVRKRLGREAAPCIVCGTSTDHDIVVSGAAGTLRRRTPRTDVRHYSLCLVCGTKIPRAAG